MPFHLHSSHASLMSFSIIPKNNTPIGTGVWSLLSYSDNASSDVHGNLLWVKNAGLLKSIFMHFPANKEWLQTTTQLQSQIWITELVKPRTFHLQDILTCCFSSESEEKNIWEKFPRNKFGIDFISQTWACLQTEMCLFPSPPRPWKPGSCWLKMRRFFPTSPCSLLVVGTDMVTPWSTNPHSGAEGLRMCQSCSQGAGASLWGKPKGCRGPGVLGCRARKGGTWLWTPKACTRSWGEPGEADSGLPTRGGVALGSLQGGQGGMERKKSTATYVNRFLWGSGEGQVKKTKAGRNIASLAPSGCPWARFPWALLQRQGCRGAEREPWARSSLQRGLKPPALEAQDPQQLALWAGRSPGEHISAVCFHTALWSCQTHTELRVFREILDCLYW